MPARRQQGCQSGSRNVCVTALLRCGVTALSWAHGAGPPSPPHLEVHKHRRWSRSTREVKPRGGRGGIISGLRLSRRIIRRVRSTGSRPAVKEGLHAPLDTLIGDLIIQS